MFTSMKAAIRVEYNVNISRPFSPQLANFLATNQDFFATPIEFRTRGHSFSSSAADRGSSPTVAQLRQRAAAYMASLSRVRFRLLGWGWDHYSDGGSTAQTTSGSVHGSRVRLDCWDGVGNSAFIDQFQ